MGLPDAEGEYAESLLSENVLEAREHLQKATELDPFYQPAQSALLMLLAFSGDDPELQRRASFMELVFPDDLTPSMARGFSRLMQGDRQGAVSDLKRLLNAAMNRTLSDDLAIACLRELAELHEEAGDVASAQRLRVCLMDSFGER